MVRTGIGFDSHRFAGGRRLVLGGVHIPYAQGLAGHSDADALCHAITDALLGAAAEGDIGSHFPDTDPQWKDARSVELLRDVAELLRSKDFAIVNIDATIVAQDPRLAPHIGEMRANLAAAVDLEAGRVSVKATTAERMGALGRGEGIAVHAIATLESRD